MGSLHGVDCKICFGFGIWLLLIFLQFTSEKMIWRPGYMEESCVVKCNLEGILEVLSYQNTVTSLVCLYGNKKGLYD